MNELLDNAQEQIGKTCNAAAAATPRLQYIHWQHREELVYEVTRQDGGL